MLLLIMAALILSTRTPPANSLISDPPRPNRKMQYGRSKVASQPFLTKPLASETGDTGGLGGSGAESSPSVRSTSSSSSSSAIINLKEVGTKDGIKRVKVFESNSGIGDGNGNPIQALEALNKMRISGNPYAEREMASSAAAISSTAASMVPNIPNAPNTLTAANAPTAAGNSNEQQQPPQQQQQQIQPQDQQQAQKAAIARSWQKPSSPSSGLANIYWRSVDVEDLRTHPFFDSLPLPDDVFASSPSEYSLFRQDSWQWGALHAGRLTTARAASCLGFYEQHAARVLKVPRSLSGHSKELSGRSKAVHAFEHLQEEAPDSWSFLNHDYVLKYPNEAREMQSIKEIKDKNCVEGAIVENGGKVANNDDNDDNNNNNNNNNDVNDGKKKKRNGYRTQPDNKPNNQMKTKINLKSNVWIPLKGNNSVSQSSNSSVVRTSFPFTYRPKGKHSGERGYSSASSARMAWGSSQEATAVLVAINYFHKHGCKVTVRGENGEDTEDHTIVAEAGMFTFEALTVPLPSDPIGSALLLDWVRDGSLPLIGASPDGMLRHPDGSCEVLEVKCHSPFIDNRYNYNNSYNSNSSNNSSNSSYGGRGGRGGRGGGGRGDDRNREGLSISDRGPADSVATWHIPQLQLHILCAGPTCTGAVLVSLSATKGATLFRVKRDDKYIMEMMTWIRKFYITYVRASTTRKNTIPENYFQYDIGYEEFLKKTLRICSDSVVVANVENVDVQRSPLNGNFFI